MPTAAEIFADAQSTDSSVQANHVIISEDLRTMEIPEDQMLLGVTNDESVRKVWFDMPAECDGLDMSEFDIYVNYRNARNVYGRYKVATRTVSQDGIITFPWVVSRTATVMAGTTLFNVCLRRYDEDGITVLNEFNTIPATMNVVQGLTVDEEVAIVYRDEINELLDSIEITPEMIGLGLTTDAQVDSLFE